VSILFPYSSHAIQTKLGLESTYYFTNPNVNPAVTSGSTSGGQQRFTGSAGLENTNIKGVVLFDTYSKSLAGELQKAYLGFQLDLAQQKDAKLDSKLDFRLGRILSDWNQADREWSLGLYEPQYRYDVLNPLRVGQIGLQTSLNYQKLKWSGLFSPLSIPERGSDIQAQNGHLISQSPWAAKAPDRVIISGVNEPLNYDIHMPSLMSLIAKPGFFTSLSWNQLNTTDSASDPVLEGDQGLSAQVTYAYKPISQVLLEYTFKKKNTAPSGQAAVYENFATLNPWIGYAHVISGDMGYRFKNFKLQLSGFKEIPVLEQRDLSQVTSQWLTEANGLSATASAVQGRRRRSRRTCFALDTPDVAIAGVIQRGNSGTVAR
jgi:hypothetical protein